MTGVALSRKDPRCSLFLPTLWREGVNVSVRRIVKRNRAVNNALRVAAIVPWLCWVIGIARLWLQWRAGVSVPEVGILVFAFVIGSMSVVLATFLAFVRIIKRRDRRAALRWWLLLAHGPTILVVAHGTYAIGQLRSRTIPNNMTMRTAEMAGASMITAQTAGMARITGDNVVMISCRAADQRRDAEAMDRFVGSLSNDVLGAPLRTRVHWVRASSVLRTDDLRGLALRSVALGNVGPPTRFVVDSRDGPIPALSTTMTPQDEVARLDHVDRHEVAHAVLNQYLSTSSDVPALLFEGWAEAVAWLSEQRQLRVFLSPTDGRAPLTVVRVRSFAPTLKELVSPGSYHLHQGLAYGIGGLLVRFILDRYGARAFIHLVNDIQPSNTDEACRRAIGVGLSELDRLFWSHLEELDRRR
jgi:hypothetical protein